MTKRLLFFFLLSCTGISPLYAQDIETEIRALEAKEVQAILARDSSTLLKLWDANYTVNSPDNVVYSAGATTLDRPVLKRARTSFNRNIEKIIVKDNLAIAMGSETVTPTESETQPPRIVKRRYTNIWMKEGNEWKLIARHANIICTPTP